MPRKPHATFVCPQCGADVRVGAAACPECGSDDETGWSDEAYLGEVDLPDGYGEPDDGEETDRVVGVPRWVVVAVIATLIVAFLLSLAPIPI